MYCAAQYELLTVRVRTLLFVGLVWIGAAGVSYPVTSLAAGPSDQIYADFERQSKEDKTLFDAVLKQGFDLFKGIPPGTVKPDSAWGPYNFRGVKQPFGWSADVYTFNGANLKYFLLTDIRQDTARAFNRAVLGRDAVLVWEGVGRGAQILPYGLFTADWGNAILLPVAWLEEQLRQQGKREAIAAGKTDLAGVSRDSNELANYGLYWFDRFVAAGIVSASTDMTQVANALESLMRYEFDSLQINGGRDVWRIQQQRTTCRALNETFTRQDCLKVLNAAFADLGKKVNASNRLLIASTPNAPAPKWTWIASTGRMEFKSVAYRTDGCGHPQLVCKAFAKYGAGKERADSPDNLVCYRVAGGLPKDLTFSMTEAEARRISKAEADANQPNMAGLLLKIDQAPALKSEPQKCANSNDRIVAEGRATIESKMLWSGLALEASQRH